MLFSSSDPSGAFPGGDLDERWLSLGERRPRMSVMDPELRQDYAPPTLRTLGTVHELTLTGNFCWRGKELGGSDGFTFMGIAVPISNCSP